MEKQARNRSRLIVIFFVLVVAYFLFRLYSIQVVQADWLQEKAKNIWTESEIIQAKRGIITDRNGKPLAEDSTAYTVSVNPEQIAARGLANDVANGLASILAPSPDAIPELQKKIFVMATKKRANSNKYLVDVQIRNEGWKIDGETKQKVDAFVESLKVRTGHKNVGIAISETTRRFYANNSLASHVLGFLDKEGSAKSGIELQFDDLLKGTNGKLISEQDKVGIELPGSQRTYIPSIDGKTLQLTIDQTIQFYVENALQKTYLDWKPKSASVVVADPRTMEILALANYPDFNPNKYWETTEQKYFVNRAISRPYEPGSTFKLVGLASAVEEGIFNPNDKYLSGQVAVGGHLLRDHNISGWGKISFLEGLLRSSNVGFIKLGQMLGNDKLKSYITKFGFGAKTNIELPGEVRGTAENMRYDSEYATATYGQGLVTVTAMQLTAAYSAIANGGKLLSPLIVKNVVNPETNQIEKTYEPQLIRRVVSEETAKQSSLYLEQVVANQEMGTGKKGYINGYRIAGKTGTASIVPDGERRYSDNTWLISFVAYAPVEDPQVLVTLMLEEPDLGGNFHRGSDAWSPLFKSIMSQTLSHLGIGSNSVNPSLKSGAKVASMTEPIATVPDVTGFTTTQAKNVLTQVGLKADTLGNGPKVLKQFPTAGSNVSLSQRVYLIMDTENRTPTVDMKGKSLREAMEVCSLLSITCKTSGEGFVVSQSLVEDGSWKLELKPPSELVIMDTLAPQVPSAKAQDNPKKSTPSPSPTATPKPTSTSKPTSTPAPTSSKKPSAS
jgi:penicillin-binding protein 2B